MSDKPDRHQGFEWIAVREPGMVSYYNIKAIAAVKIASHRRAVTLTTTDGHDITLGGRSAQDVIQYVENVVSRVYVPGDPANA